MVRSERMEALNEKLKGFCDSKTLKIGNFEGEVLMNVGKDNEVLLFKRDGTHEYLTKEEFERLANRKRVPRPNKDVSVDRNWDDWSVEYKDILYSNMKYVYAVI